MCYIESSVNCMIQLHWGKKTIIKTCTSRREFGHGPISLEITSIPHMPLTAKNALPQQVCSYSDVILRVHTMQDLTYHTKYNIHNHTFPNIQHTYIASANTPMHHASSHHLLPPCAHEHSYIMTCEFEWEKTTHTTYVKWLTTFYSRYCHMELIIYSLTDATSYHLSPPHVHMFVHADLWVSTRESYINTYVQYYLSLIILTYCHM